MEKINPKEIGTRIKEVRKMLKLTQVTAAKKSNISRSYYADIENGRYSPSTDTLMKISTALGVSTLYLLEGKKTPSDYDILDDGSVIEGVEFIKSFDNVFYESALSQSKKFLDNPSSYSPKEVFAISKLYNLIETLQKTSMDHLKNSEDTLDFVGILLQNLNYQVEKNPELSLKDFYNETISKTEYPRQD